MDLTSADRFELQAEEYRFPYHWLPAATPWRPGRIWPFALEYLGILRATIATVLDQRPRRVLDFGCGDGRLAYELLASGVDELVGVDLVPAAIHFATGFTTPFPNRATFYCDDIRRLSLAPFDVIVAMEVFEHIPTSDLPDITRAIASHLGHDGRLVISVPTTNVTVPPKHERHFTVSTLEAALQPHFTITTISYIHRPSLLYRALRRPLINRHMLLWNVTLLTLMQRLYFRHVWPATAGTGSHMIAVAAPDPHRD